MPWHPLQLWVKERAIKVTYITASLIQQELLLWRVAHAALVIFNHATTLFLVYPSTNKGGSHYIKNVQRTFGNRFVLQDILGANRLNILALICFTPTKRWSIETYQSRQGMSHVIRTSRKQQNYDIGYIAAKTKRRTFRHDFIEMYSHHLFQMTLWSRWRWWGIYYEAAHVDISVATNLLVTRCLKRLRSPYDMLYVLLYQFLWGGLWSAFVSSKSVICSNIVAVKLYARSCRVEQSGNQFDLL